MKGKGAGAVGEGEEGVNPPPWLSDPRWRWFLTIVLASVAAGIVTGAIFFIAMGLSPRGWRRGCDDPRARDGLERYYISMKPFDLPPNGPADWLLNDLRRPAEVRQHQSY
jgi:hypothetical protein